MRLVALVALATVMVGTVEAQVRVNGYTRSDGTYVAPHMRSAPDSSRVNNWSSQGNTNPYTGERGNQNPYAQPSFGGSSSRGSNNGFGSTGRSTFRNGWND